MEVCMSEPPAWTSPGDPPADGTATRAVPGDVAGGAQWGQPQPGVTQPPPGWGQPQPGSGSQPAWGQPQPAWGPQASWGGWSGGPAPAKPGVIPLRPLGVGEILDGAITTIRRYPKATLGMSAVVVTISQVLQFLLVRSFAESLTGVDVASELDFDGTGAAAAVFGTMLGFIVNVMLTGALTVVMGQAVLGRPIELAEAWRTVRSRLWALIGTSLLVLLLMAISVVLLVIPFFFAWPALSLATPALMLERQPVWRAIRRSVALVRGQFWRCLGVVLLAWLVKSTVGGVLAIPFTLFGGGMSLFDPTATSSGDLGTSYLVMTTIGAIVSGTVVAPFSAGVSALLYVDRRMRAEGLDVALAAAAAGPAPTAAATAG